MNSLPDTAWLGNCEGRGAGGARGGGGGDGGRGVHVDAFGDTHLTLRDEGDVLGWPGIGLGMSWVRAGWPSDARGKP